MIVFLSVALAVWCCLTAVFTRWAIRALRAEGGKVAGKKVARNYDEYCQKGHYRKTTPCPKCVAYYEGRAQVRQVEEAEGVAAAQVEGMISALVERIRQLP